jgi:hypothetical protein
MSIFRKRPDDETDGREMTREAFRKAMASGQSPGAASLLAEMERGWARQDGESEPDSTLPGHRAAPDAFEPGPLDWYVAWLRGYLKRGGRITHVYDHPYSRARFVRATRDFTTGDECGADARSILVPSGVQHLGGRIGHCNLYFEDGYGQKGILVPAYSDPPFADLPGYAEVAAKAHAQHEAYEEKHREREARRRGQARTSDLSAYIQDGER